MHKNYYTNLYLTKEQAEGHITYLRPYLDAIIRRAPNKEIPLLEIGIGTGLCCTFLSSVGYLNSFGIDIEPEIVDKFLHKSTVKFSDKTQVRVANGFDLYEIEKGIRPIGCIYHQGLLEHFSDEKVDRLLGHHVEMSGMYVVFAVPIEGYKNGGGLDEYDENEVHHSVEWWLNRVSPFKLYEYGVFGIDTKKNQAYFVIGKR